MKGLNISRRRTIQLAMATCVSFAGCARYPDTNPTNNTATATRTTASREATSAETPTTALNEIYFELEPADLNQDQLEWIKPIQFDDLPAAEREIVESAVREGPYTERKPWSEPLQSLVDRIEEHKYSQIDAYQESHAGNDFPRYLDAAYLVKEDRYYSIFLVVNDVVVSA